VQVDDGRRPGQPPEAPATENISHHGTDSPAQDNPRRNGGQKPACDPPVSFPHVEIVDAIEGSSQVTAPRVAKLSPLQWSILRMAYERHGRKPVDLFYAEILVECFHFPAVRDLDHPGSQHFSRTQIGYRAYDSALSAASRSVREQRGLVDLYCGRYSRWSGLTLTDHGAVAAQPVTTEVDLPQSEPVTTTADLRESEPLAADGGWSAA
jgi:hypothetical protein